MLGVDTGTVRRYIALGELEAVRLPSGVWRIPQSAVLALLKKGREP